MHQSVELGREEGADLVTGGELPAGEGAFYPPTVLPGVENQMVVAQEEIFGPVATVVPFEDEADAARIPNDAKYGLMATVWRQIQGEDTRSRARSGPATVGNNMPYTAFPGVAFGGYKQSGSAARSDWRRSSPISKQRA